MYFDDSPLVPAAELYLSPWFYFWCFVILAYIFFCKYHDRKNVGNALRLYVFAVPLWLTAGHLHATGSMAELIFYTMAGLTTFFIFLALISNDSFLVEKQNGDQ